MIEKRSNGEVREIGEQGQCSAYLTKWGSVDSYKSTFKAGAFKASIKKRGVSGIRLLWNHETLCGKILDIKEDDIGVLADVQFNLETEAGRDAFAHVKAGDINCFSFGFRTERDRVGKDGVREILQVDLLECSPVVFQANDQAFIVDIREGIVDIRKEDTENEEDRAVKFEDSLTGIQLSSKRQQILNALDYTLSDIHYDSNIPTNLELKAEVQEAIAAFQNAYLEWIDELILHSGNSRFYRNSLAKSTIEYASKEYGGLDSFARNSNLTFAQISSLAHGDICDIDYSALPDSIRAEYEKIRKENLHSVLSEMRSQAFTDEEKKVLKSVLKIEDNNESYKILEQLKTKTRI